MILQLRLRRNLTVTEVAAYLGISNTYYRELEEGKIMASPTILISLAELYSTSFFPQIPEEKTIININCGTGSHSNSGYIHRYLNSPEIAKTNSRLTEIEHLLQLILLQLKANGNK